MVKVAGKRDFPHHILQGRGLWSLILAQVLGMDRTAFTAETVGVQAADQRTPGLRDVLQSQPQVAVHCPLQYVSS